MKFELAGAYPKKVKGLRFEGEGAFMRIKVGG